MADFKNFGDIKTFRRNSCRVCERTLSVPLIRLSGFPLTEFFVKEKPREKKGFFDQEYHFCENCGFGQLSNVIDTELVYGSDYITRTSTSPSAIWALEIFLDFINKVLKGRKIDQVLEIGCNDLYLLRKMKNKARVLYGIDPVLRGREKQLEDNKIRIIPDFFEKVEIKGLGLKTDVVLSSHTLEHIENPKSLFQKILDAGTERTVYFFQFPGLESLVADAHFDQIYHQHLNYFSFPSVQYLLGETGGELIAARKNPYHWGAWMIAFRKKSKRKLNIQNKKEYKGLNPEYILKQYKLFRNSINNTAERIDSYKGRKIYGYGAAQMLPVLEYYLERISTFCCILDDDRKKDNLYYLNVPVKIKYAGGIKDLDKSVVVVTAINSLQTIRSIIGKLISLNVEKIIFPVNLV